MSDEAKGKRRAKGRRTTKGDPYPCRFDTEEQAGLEEINAETGMSYAEIIRRACRFSFPKFLSGEVPISKVKPTEPIQQQ